MSAMPLICAEPQEINAMLWVVGETGPIRRDGNSFDDQATVSLFDLSADAVIHCLVLIPHKPIQRHKKQSHRIVAVVIFVAVD